MAEGGNQNGKDNPFSFKHFVQKKDVKRNEHKHESTDKDSDELDIFNFPESPLQKKKEKTRPVLLVEDDMSSKLKGKKSQNENPFSFRKFLSSDKNSPAQGSESGITGKSSSSSISKGAPDLASDLPDFVQDHLNDPTQEVRHSADLDLPDFTLSGPNNIPDVSAVIDNGIVNDIGELFPFKNRAVNNLRNISDRQVKEPSVDGDLFESSLEEERTSRTQFVVGALPDFLSDGAIGTAVDNCPDPFSQHQIDDSAKIIQSEQIDLSEQIRENFSELGRLREENSSLRQQLQKSQQKLTAESARVAELMCEVEALKRKEVEETATMEKVIQQVEANLTTTTKRAVSAESNVAKLKQEVKALQAQVSSLQENTVLQSGDRGLTDIKERTEYVSEQLSSAAQTAETSIRQLLSGVENLKLLSQVLTSVDRFTEVPGNGPKPNTEESPKPSVA